MPYQPIRARLVDFAADARGSIAILGAAFSLCALAALAIGIDVSSVLLDRRRLQGAADLAAMAAAADLSNADRAARATLEANGMAAPKEMAVVLGNYVADPGAAAAGRFRANTTPYNAVEVRVGADASLYFGRKLVNADSLIVRTSAVAVNTEVVAFTVGSRLASLNGGIANALLSGLVGGQISLSVMNYNALASAKVEALTFLDALAVRTKATAGTYDQALAARATIGDVIGALADVGGGGASSKAALAQIAAGKPSRPVDLGELIKLGPYGDRPVGSAATSGLSASVSLLDLLATSAGIANGSNQVALDLGAQVPGLLGLTASLTIGERAQSSPWLSIGQKDVTVSTAQTRLRLTATVGGGLLPTIKLPLAVDLASAKAQLSSLSCGRNPAADAKVDLAVTPSVADLWVGEPVSASSWADVAKPPQIGPATLVSSLLLKVTGQSHVAASNLSPTTVRFTAADIANRASKTVKTNNAVQSTLSSLTQNLSLSVDVTLLGSLSLGSNAVVKALLTSILTPVGALIDPVLNSLLNVLGVSIGEADVTIRGMRCDGAALVG